MSGNTSAFCGGCSLRCLLTLGILFSVAEAALAQSKPKGPAAAVEERVTTADGWTIPLTYYPSHLGKEAPVIVLLHMEKGKRLEWESNGIARRLQQEGFAVIAPDLRKHGEASHPNERVAGGDLRALDYKAIASVSPVGDLEAVKRFIFDEHQKEMLNMAKMGILAASDMAPVALQWVENDWAKRPYNDAPTLAASTPRGQDVKAVALLSPRERVTGLAAGQAVRVLSNLPVAFMILHSSNSADKRDAERIHEQLVSVPAAKDRVHLQGYTVPLRGTDLLGERAKNLKIDLIVVGFFQKYLKELPIEWRDRRSRLTR